MSTDSKSVLWIFLIYLVNSRILGMVSGASDSSMTTIYVKAKEGTPVEIPCACPTAKPGKHVMWSKVETQSLVISRRGRHGKVKVGHEWAGDNIDINGTFLKIPSLQYPRDHGQFSCQSEKIRTDVTITVLAPVKDTEIIGMHTINELPRLDVVEKTSTNLMCRAVAYPPPTFTWFLESKPLKPDTASTASATNNSVIILTVSRDMDMKPVTCKTTSVLQGNGQSTAYLRVLYPPSAVSITGPSSSVVEGNPVRLRCEAGGQPEPLFTWERLALDSSTRAILLANSSVYTTMAVSRSEAGEYRCTADNSQGKTSNTFTITVLHPPVLRVELDRSSMTLTCRAEANPSGVTFGEWTQRLDGEVITTRTGITEGQTTHLNLPALTYEDTGFYVCSASNSINNSESAFYVQPETKAIFPADQTTVFAGLFRRRFQAPISFYIHPKPTLIRWDKTQVDGLASRETYSWRQKAVNLTLTFHKKHAKIPGTQALLVINRLYWYHAGNYTLTVGNGRGLTVFRFTIDVTPPRLGQSESARLGPLTVGLMVAGGCILLFILTVIVICIFRRTSETGCLSKSRNGSFSPAEEKAVNPEPTDNPTTDNLDPISPTDVLLKEDVNENLHLS